MHGHFECSHFSHFAKNMLGVCGCWVGWWRACVNSRLLVPRIVAVVSILGFHVHLDTKRQNCPNDKRDTTNDQQGNRAAAAFLEEKKLFFWILFLHLKQEKSFVNRFQKKLPQHFHRIAKTSRAQTPIATRIPCFFFWENSKLKKIKIQKFKKVISKKKKQQLLQKCFKI